MGHTADIYSRPVTVAATDLAAGDLLNVAIGTHAGDYWQKITGVDLVACQEDPNEDDRDEPCDGTCVVVLSMEQEEESFFSTMHIPTEDRYVRARLAANATGAEIEAENEAHDDGHAAAYQAAVIVHQSRLGKDV